MRIAQQNQLFLKQSHRQQQTDQQNPLCGCQCCDHLLSRNLIVFNIAFFQFTAMTFYAYGVVQSGGYLNFQTVFLVILCLFISYCWCGRFSGTFLNPSIVIACLFVKEKKMAPILAPVYIIVEFLGAIAGALLAWYISDSPLVAPAMSQLTFEQTSIVFGRQLIGTFFYTIAFLNVASPDTSFAEIQIQVWFAIPFLLTTLSQLVNLPMGFNPAFGLAYQLSWSIYQNQESTLLVLWAVVFGPCIGAIIGALVYEYVYRRILAAHRIDQQKQQKLLRDRKELHADSQFVKRVSVLQLV